MLTGELRGHGAKREVWNGTEWIPAPEPDYVTLPRRADSPFDIMRSALEQIATGKIIGVATKQDTIDVMRGIARDALQKVLP